MGRMRRNLLLWSVVLAMAMGTALFSSPRSAAAAEKEDEDKRPARALAIYPEYPGVVVPKGEDVRMDILVVNKGRADEDVLLKVTQIPKGWEARVKTYSFTVTGVHVPDGETKTVTFLAEPGKEVEKGAYLFKMLGKTKDGFFESEKEISVVVKGKGEEKEKKDIVITTSYPVLRGPSDATFEFSMEVENKMDKDGVFNLSAKGPPDWAINFKPAYEDKYISSLRLKSGASKSVGLQVKPLRFSETGEYPVDVTVSADGRKAQARLKLVLTGTYKLDAGTSTGLLSLSTQRGKTANISLYVKNSGSAPQNEVTFLSFKPENWKVEFEPERLEALPPGEIKQVEVRITPDEEALVGDYSVGINVKGERVSDDVELRVTVKSSSTWGWIGVGIILVVIAGLCVLFIVLGRR